MKKKGIKFRMIFEFKDGDGAVVPLKYGPIKRKCINPYCEKESYLQIKLELSDDISKDFPDHYYPICPICFYKNVRTLSRYCDYN